MTAFVTLWSRLFCRGPSEWLLARATEPAQQLADRPRGPGQA
ncbi:hypothetical protein ACFU53_47085 [Streptomyces sp. NPDC057474]